MLEGAQQFATFQLVLLARALVQAALFVAVILADLGIGSLGAVSFISSAVMFLTAWILAKRAVRNSTCGAGTSLASRCESSSASAVVSS